MQTAQVTHSFVAFSPVFPNDMYVVEERGDGSILVTVAWYHSGYSSIRRNDFRMPPRNEWEAGGWRHRSSYVPLPKFNTVEAVRKHYEDVCGFRLLVIEL